MRHLREVPEKVLVAFQFIEMMSLHVSVKVRLLVEPLVAVGELTWEWFLASVNSLMGFQVKV
jgi:hypothetical protein